MLTLAGLRASLVDRITAVIGDMPLEEVLRERPSGFPPTTLHRFIAGAPVRSSTIRLIEGWLEKEESRLSSSAANNAAL